MRCLVSLLALAALTALTALGCTTDPPPATTCTGHAVDNADPLERLPFHAEGLAADCQITTPSESPTSDADVFASIATSFEDLGAQLGCSQPPTTLDVDFTHEEVLILDIGALAQIDGVFAFNDSVIVSSSADLTGCRGVGPSLTRALSVLQRSGDLDVEVRSCVTTDEGPTGPFAPAPEVCP